MHQLFVRVIGFDVYYGVVLIAVVYIQMAVTDDEKVDFHFLVCYSLMRLC